MLNKILKDFSKNDNIIFFDTRLILKQKAENNFIDSCCHLSKSGADIVGFYLSKIVQ
jgi:hypothetical protein